MPTGYLVRLDLAQKEHARLTGLGVNGFYDMLTQGAKHHPDGTVEVPINHYHKVQAWKKQKIANPDAPPVHTYATSSSSAVPTAGDAPKGCGCARRKQVLNNIIPGLGNAVAAIAEPIAQHVVNPIFGTNFTSKEPEGEVVDKQNK